VISIVSSSFYRFWLINQQGLYIFDKKLTRKERIILTKAEEDALIADIMNNDPKILEDDTAIFVRDIDPTFTRLYYKKYKKDLYLLLVDELMDITDVVQHFQIWMDVRKRHREHLKGMVFCIFDDVEGPKVIYNNFLEEDDALLLAIQGQTVTSMGRVEEFITGFKEAIKVPNREDLVHLSYDFLQSAPESKDPRIAKMGRISNLYLLFQRDNPYLNEEHFRSYVESFIDEWVYNWEALNGASERYSAQIFNELYEDLRDTVTIAIDMTTHEEREIAKLKVFVMELLGQNKVLNYQIRRLRERIKELEHQLGLK